jgi:GntR family transcriptional regulator, galactonate operon transcriptional repressor
LVAIYSKRGVHGQTVREVARRILVGEYPEGATIDVTSLERDLDVSRTALREALKVLAAKGLVDARQKRGTFVRSRSDWNLLDADIIRWQFAERSDDGFLDNLHEVRRIVEPAGARLAAQRRTDDDLAALETALETMAAADGRPAEAVDADLAFHRALLAATHNELLVRMEVLLETGLATRDRLVHGADPHDDPVPSHQAVLDAIRSQDPSAAESAVHALLDKALADLKKTRRGVRRRSTT